MSLEGAFLGDIIEHPDDDTPRLVYADWLDDNGDPERAEFIRVQIERASLPIAEPRARALRLRERELLDRNQRRWKDGLGDVGLVWPQFHRGFIESGEIHAEVFLSVGLNLWRRWPIRDLTLYNPGPVLGALSRQEELGRLQALRLQTPVNDRLPVAGLGAFLSSEHLAGLRALDLGSANVGEGLPFLLHPRRARFRLRELGVSSNGLTNASLTILAQLESLGELTSLDVRNNLEVQDEGILELMNSPGLHNLRCLQLEGCPVGAEGMRATCFHPSLCKLTYDAWLVDPAVIELLCARFGNPAQEVE